MSRGRLRNCSTYTLLGTQPCFWKSPILTAIGLAHSWCAWPFRGSRTGQQTGPPAKSSPSNVIWGWKAAASSSDRPTFHAVLMCPSCSQRLGFTGNLVHVAALPRGPAVTRNLTSSSHPLHGYPRDEVTLPVHDGDIRLVRIQQFLPETFGQQVHTLLLDTPARKSRRETPQFQNAISNRH